MSERSAHSLPAPPFYFPLRHGRYDVAPGLIQFGKDLGGGTADAHVFQIDRSFDQFRQAKLASLTERHEKYVCAAELNDDVAAEVGTFIVQRLVAEHPAHFSLECAGHDTLLHCDLTGETIALGHGIQPVNVVDGLARQVQEDLAIVSVAAEGRRHWLSYAHVCLPNGWAPDEKIGRSFAQVHEPVAGMAEMNRRGDEFVTVMTRATHGLVRFAWGITFDDRLNHHPESSRTPFGADDPHAFLRVERQTMWGFPRRNAALFTIRTYLYDCNVLRRDPATREPLVAALRSMTSASMVYKGIAPYADALVEWLTTRP